MVKKDRGTNTRCKLMGLDFFYQCCELSNEDRREFITDMIFLAQRKRFQKLIILALLERFIKLWYNRTINKIYENAFPISKRGKSISSITRG